MIPDKEGYWWLYHDRFGTHVSHVIKNMDDSWIYRIVGSAEFMKCNNPQVRWLGPVNPEPMKASGE